MSKIKTITLVAALIGGVITGLFFAIRKLNQALERMSDGPWADLVDEPDVKSLPDELLPDGVDGYIPAPRPRDWPRTEANDNPV